jgi:site-specific recombinase XerD
LIPKRETSTKTLGPFLQEYIEGRQDVRPDTKVVWRHVQQNLLDYFSTGKALRSIIEADDDGFKQHLIQDDLAMATVAKRLQVCRMIFKAAMRAKYISANPFQGMSAPATVKAEEFSSSPAK